MFWSKKKTVEKKKSECGGGSSKDEPNSKSHRIREEALANARQARLSIGEETLDKIAAAMTKKQQSVVEQAKGQIKTADPDKVLDELLYMLKNR